jgi:hypothetical protein
MQAAAADLSGGRSSGPGDAAKRAAPPSGPPTDIRARFGADAIVKGRALR